MKLLITKIDDYNNRELSKLIDQFYCTIDILNTTEPKMIINKHPGLTDGEFSLLAGKLVIAGLNVELLKNE